MYAEKAKKALHYVKTHMTRFLLLAVVLTSAVSSRQVAQAKYTSYLYDYTSAVAGDFYLSSDYLGLPEENRLYTIGSWDKRTYSLPLSIRNYEDSLRFNKTGTDVFYYVWAEVYADTNGNKAYDEGEDQLSSNFPEENITCTLKNKVGTYKAGSSSASPVYDCALLKGTETFDNSAGAQEVTVSINSTTTVSTGQFLVVHVKTIPLKYIDRITIDPVDNSNVPEGEPQKEQIKLADYKRHGVFETELTGTFALIATEDKVEVKAEFYQRDNDYTVTCKLTCESATSAAGTAVKIFFNNKKLSADGRLTAKVTEENTDISYVEITVASESIENVYFFKQSLSEELQTGTKGSDLWYEAEGAACTCTTLCTELNANCAVCSTDHTKCTLNVCVCTATCTEGNVNAACAVCVKIGITECKPTVVPEPTCICVDTCDTTTCPVCAANADECILKSPGGTDEGTGGETGGETGGGET